MDFHLCTHLQVAVGLCKAGQYYNFTVSSCKNCTVCSRLHGMLNGISNLSQMIIQHNNLRFLGSVVLCSVALRRRMGVGGVWVANKFGIFMPCLTGS